MDSAVVLWSLVKNQTLESEKFLKPYDWDTTRGKADFC